MCHEWLSKVKSRNGVVRRAGWIELRESCAKRNAQISLRRRRELADLAFREEDDDIWRLAISVLARVCVEPLVKGESRQGPAKGDAVKRHLANWLWDPFKHPSMVVWASNPPYQRDQATLFDLGRHLSSAGFPNVMRYPVYLKKPNWRGLRGTQPDAICVVGRLGLFGDEALEWWSPRDMAYRFKLQKRPAEVEPGTLHPDYHCVVEWRADRPRKEYTTAQTLRERVDYALVQRFVTNDGTHQTVIVNCAGATSLGTLGAVIWATRDVSRPMWPGGAPIPLPPGVHLGSRMEALLKVTADITDDEWSPNRVELKRLYLDNSVWSKDRKRWELKNPRCIELVMSGDRREDAVSVRLDGKTHRMERQGETFRLLVTLCLMWPRHRRHGIDLKDLMVDRWIWGGRTADEQRLRNRLKQLKNRYLRESLTIDHRVRLRARIEIVREKPDSLVASPTGDAKSKKSRPETPPTGHVPRPAHKQGRRRGGRPKSAK
jgi:hypothetical protein